MAQHVEHYSTLHQIVDNESVIVNESSEIVWPISNDEELNIIEKLLDNRLIKNNQVNFKYSSIVNITIYYNLFLITGHYFIKISWH